jgi:hypothetical protein
MRKRRQTILLTNVKRIDHIHMGHNHHQRLLIFHPLQR